MKTYNNAVKYSNDHPTELVDFAEWYCISEYRTGFFLNGKREGAFKFYEDSILRRTVVYNSKTQHAENLRFRSNGSIENHYFRKNHLMHGEAIWFNKDGSVNEYFFYNSGAHVEELDELLDAERDDAFYVTLALCGIDSEYIFK